MMSSDRDIASNNIVNSLQMWWVVKRVMYESGVRVHCLHCLCGMPDLSNNSSDYRVKRDVDFEAVCSAVKSKVTTLVVELLVYHSGMQNGLLLFQAIVDCLCMSRQKWTTT